MLINYLGPSDFVRVPPYGRHWQDQVKEYPDEFGADLLASSTKQQFEEVDDGVVTETPDLADMTVKELKELAAKLEIDVDAKAKKNDLVAAIEGATGEPPEEE